MINMLHIFTYVYIEMWSKNRVFFSKLKTQEVK
jgi:hypothetical protein